MVNSNRFMIGLGLKKERDVSVYFLDPNFYNGYFIDDLKLEIPINNDFFQIFDVTFDQIIQSQDDPTVKCQPYEPLLGYYNCVTEKFEETFLDLITCVPPWFSDDQEKVCQNENVKNATLAASRQGYSDIMAGENLAVFHNF